MLLALVPAALVTLGEKCSGDVGFATLRSAFEVSQLCLDRLGGLGVIPNLNSSRQGTA